MEKILFSLVVISFLIGGLNASASHDSSSSAGITPDSPFYIFKTLKENIQTFFTFGEENKAKQFLHLADVRLAEYQKMLEKGKTDIAQKTLDKYEKQLNRAISKVEELKNKGKDVKDISERMASSTAKHIEILQKNLEKVPESAKKGLERALENARKEREKVDETAGWKTYRNEEYGFEIKYPKEWIVSYEGGPIYISSQRDDIPLPYRNVEISIHQSISDLELFFRKRVDPSWFEDMVVEKDININNTIKAKEQTFNGPLGKFKAVLIPITKDLFSRFFPGVYFTRDEEVDSVIQLSYLEPEFGPTFDQMISTFRFLPVRQ